jgi:hypothetical protein
MWFSSVATVLGALMYWVLTYQDTGIDLTIVGVVFMIIGAVGFIISSIIYGLSLLPTGAVSFSLRRLALNPEEQSGVVSEDA